MAVLGNNLFAARPNYPQYWYQPTACKLQTIHDVPADFAEWAVLWFVCTLGGGTCRLLRWNLAQPSLRQRAKVARAAPKAVAVGHLARAMSHQRLS